MNIVIEQTDGKMFAIEDVTAEQVAAFIDDLRTAARYDGLLAIDDDSQPPLPMIINVAQLIRVRVTR